MNTALTIAAFLLLVAGGAYVIHRLNSAHDERIAAHTYSRFASGRRADDDRADGTAAPPPSHAVPAAARDLRDGGRGRFRPHRRKGRAAPDEPTATGR
ncbi:hypothetical protein [Streptomyces sp. NPDC052701]|uniref:hypothetical protein n=1 Tax=Streptomyces sp. NPDC052701 TaxID=3155533 RepID=UPI00342FA614